MYFLNRRRIHKCYVCPFPKLGTENIKSYSIDAKISSQNCKKQNKQQKAKIKPLLFVKAP